MEDNGSLKEELPIYEPKQTSHKNKSWISKVSCVSRRRSIIPWSIEDHHLDIQRLNLRRKREKDKNKFKLDGYDDKHQGADEVYIMTSSKEEAAEVYNMNDAQGRMTVKSREKMVREADGKLVNHRDFQDVKIKALNEANAKFGK